MRFRPRNTLIEVRPLGGGSYENNTGVTNDVPSDTVLQIDITFAATDTGPVDSVLSGMTWIAVFTRDFLNSGAGLAQIPVEFPRSTGAAFYNGSLINMRPNDRFDWDVMHHEYGHYVMDSFNFEDNPGRPHNIGQCLSVTRPSKAEGLRLAWGEVWPTHFGTTGQMLLGIGFTEAPRVGDAVYADTIDGFGGFSYGLDTNSNDLGVPGDLNGLGEDNELAIQRILYDLFDANGDSRDAVVRDHLDIFNVLRGSNVTTMSAAWALIRGSALVSGNADDLDFGAITSDHAVGPQPLAPSAGTIVTSANASFSWTAAVQCSDTFAGDDFDLVFYDANTFVAILTIPGLSTTSTSLSQAQILTLTAASHDILWAVEGSNTASPVTGPYLGDNLAIVVNTPPVADAGPDQPDVECTSSTTTPVQLDGTGSSDEDGDTLSYSWSAPGVVFDDSTSATPTGQFPDGSTVVTLTVSDGIQEDTDTVVITVVDTTPPEITCPGEHHGRVYAVRWYAGRRPAAGAVLRRRLGDRCLRSRSGDHQQRATVLQPGRDRRRVHGDRRRRERLAVPGDRDGGGHNAARDRGGAGSDPALAAESQNGRHRGQRHGVGHLRSQPDLRPGEHHQQRARRRPRDRGWPHDERHPGGGVRHPGHGLQAARRAGREGKRPHLHGDLHGDGWLGQPGERLGGGGGAEEQPVSRLPPGPSVATGRIGWRGRGTALVPLLLIAPALSLACLAAAREPCRAEPGEAVTVFLDDTEPVYSRVFTGTLEAVTPADESRPGRLTVRLEDGAESETLYFQHLGAGLRFPVGGRLRFQVDRVAGFPSLYGILVSDDRGLLLAAASDLAPGQGVLRAGVPGFQIGLAGSSCEARVRGGCYEEITNLSLRFTYGDSSLVLMQGESGRLGDFHLHCLAAQRVVYSDRCADAGLIALSYVIARSDLLEAAG